MDHAELTKHSAVLTHALKVGYFNRLAGLAWSGSGRPSTRQYFATMRPNLVGLPLVLTAPPS